MKKARTTKRRREPQLCSGRTFRCLRARKGEIWQLQVDVHLVAYQMLAYTEEPSQYTLAEPPETST